MIDLTKPIRTKDKKVAVTHLTYRYDVCGMLEAEFSNGGTLTCDANELTTYFENIPDPRRVREWSLMRSDYRDVTLIHKDGNVYADDYRPIRVIEWPEGAELPEWPTT